MIEVTPLLVFQTSVFVILVVLFVRAIRLGRRYFAKWRGPNEWNDIRDQSKELPIWDRGFERTVMRGSQDSPEHTLNKTTYRTTYGLRFKTLFVLVAVYLALAYKLDVYAMGALEAEFGSYPVTLFKVALIAVLAFNVLHHFVYRLTIDGKELTVTGAFFQRYSFDLGKLVAVEHRNGPMYRLRFSDGKTARILKYVTGHDEMVQAFENALAANQESTCRSFPKSKRSAVG